MSALEIQTNEGVLIEESGKLCQSLRLDGQQDMLSIAHDSDFELNKGTLSLWFKTDQLNFSNSPWLSEMVLFSKDRSGFNTGGHLRISVNSGGAMRVRHQTTSTSYVISSSSQISENTWHHIAYTWGDGGGKLYIDGSLAASNSSISATLSGNQETIIIGANAERYSSSNGTLESQLRDFFKGSIDELKLFDQALTVEQITAEYNETRTDCVSCASNTELISHWDLDLCNVSGDANEVIDIVSGNNGSIVNGVSASEFGKFCQAFEFDGNQSYVRIPHASNMEFGAGAISMWVNIPDLSHTSNPRNDGNAIFSKDNTGYNTGGHLTLRVLANGALRVRHQSTNDSAFFESSQGLITENTWHHIVYSFGSNGMRFYVDGLLVNEMQTTRTLNGNEEVIVFGASARIARNNDVQTNRLYDFFKGKLDDIKLYKNQPSSADIDSWFRQSSYNCTSCESESAIFTFSDSSSSNVNNTGNLSTSASLSSDARIEVPANPKFCDAMFVPANTSTSQKAGLDTGVDLNDFPDTQGSISFWYKAEQAWNDGTSRQLFDASEEASRVNGVYQSDKHFFLVKKGNGSLRFGIEDADDYSAIVDTGSNSFAADTWVHVSVTWNLANDNYVIYINGVASSSISRNSISTNEYGRFLPILIGDNTSSYFVNDSSRNSASGYFDNVIIRHVALSDSDALSAYQESTACEQVHHYEIIHPSTALTCDVADVEIKACANASCSQLYSQAVTLTLSPSAGWNGANPISFSGSTTTSISNASEANVSLSIVNPDASVTCSNGCDIDFSDAGFRFIDSVTGNILSQPHTLVAQTNMSGIAIQAVKNDAGVCAPVLSGSQSVDISYTCDDSGVYTYSPGVCVSPFAGVPVSGASTSSGSINMTFNSSSTATFAGYSYADVGRLQIRVSSIIDGADISAAELTLHSIPESLSVNATTSNPIIADEPFSFEVSALGALGDVMPSYQANQLQTDFRRIAPTHTSSKEANFTIQNSVSVSSIDESSSSFQTLGATSFSSGRLSSSQSKIDEVGNFSVAFRDQDYLGSEINSNTLSFSRVIPAYFDLSLDAPISIADQCSNTFSYIGQALDFETTPNINVTAYSADGSITQNYSDDDWLLRPSQSVYSSGVSLDDQSVYSGSLSVVDVGTGMSLADYTEFTGKGTMSFSSMEFVYEKIANPSGADASPFDANLNLTLDKSIFTDSDGVCYQPDFPNGGCADFVVNDISGTQLRYGRLNLINTFGPENDWLFMPIQAEYLVNGTWLLNNDDNCSSIALSQLTGDLSVSHDSQSETNISTLITNLSSTGTLMNGLSDSLDLRLSPPSIAGVSVSGSAIVTLIPQSNSGAWNDHLNIDWDLDGDIDNADAPSAIATFGIFRGNDRIIHWREVFNE
ncbi:LamG domain-containing protein [Glaciecola sp. KUL10]|uniref:LamG domain-containing protein n=1 Tax=Glaciecola sp. (strain KUL10) TaxID=2161813 RepID=UPI001313E35C|nr:LamG domain-containing protein [Glaciecola sp. KUL10]